MEFGDDPYQFYDDDNILNYFRHFEVQLENFLTQFTIDRETLYYVGIT